MTADIDLAAALAREAAGVNPVDTYIRSGAYQPPRPLPYTPGADGAGGSARPRNHAETDSAYKATTQISFGF